jgi:Ca2+-binding RTX toxin-like protein
MIQPLRGWRSSKASRAKSSRWRHLAIDALEQRALLSVAPLMVNHTPHLQLGNAPLVGMPGSTTDRIEILWQTRPTSGALPLQFTIDAAQSYLDFSGQLVVPGDPPATAPFEPQPGSSTLAHFSGTLLTQLSGSSIAFPGGSAALGGNQGGSFAPGSGDANVAFQMSLSPGGPPFITGAFRNGLFDLTSTVLTVDGAGEFSAGDLNVLLASPGVFDFKIGAGAVQQVDLSSLGPVSNQTLSSGLIEQSSGEWILTIPIYGTSTFADPGGSGIFTDFAIVGQIVAKAELDDFAVDYRAVGATEWTAGPAVGSIVTGVEDRINRFATITGLAFDSSYEYRVTHTRGGQVVDTYQHTFRTRLPAGSTSPLSFVAYGDSVQGDPPSGHISVQTRINTLDPDFALLLGDNSNDHGAHFELDRRFDPTINLPATQWMAQHVDYFTFSNHDIETSNGQPTLDNYSVPIPELGVTSPVAPPLGEAAERFYSFDYGDIHFATFDSNAIGEEPRFSRLMEWLEADLAASNATWKIVFAGKPLVSLSDHLDANASNAYFQDLFPILQAAGVDLFLTGDAHNYQRSFPLLGSQGTEPVFIADPNSRYVKGAGLVHVINGTGGAELRGTKLAAAMGGSYLAAGFDLSTTPAVEHGTLYFQLNGDELTVQLISAATGQILDEFFIGPDMDAPWANLSLDGTLGDLDLDSHQVTVTIPPASISLILHDDAGDAGVDNATVLASTVAISHNGTPLVEGLDYTFSYDSQTHQITLTSLSGNFGEGTYSFSVSGGIHKISDHSLNEMSLQVLLFKVDTSISTLSFEQGLDGYSGVVDTQLDGSSNIDPSSGLPRNQTSYQDLSSLRWDTYEAGGARYTLIRFQDLFGAQSGQIPLNSEIAFASLSYFVGANGAIADLYEISIDWDGTVTFDNFGATAGVQPLDFRALPSAELLGQMGLQTVNVTVSLQAWAANPAANRGWIIVPRNSDGAVVYSSEAAAGYRPRLTVQYVSAENSLPVAHAGEVYQASTGQSVQLSASASFDPDSGQSLTYRWDINGDHDFSDAVGVNPLLTWADLVNLGLGASATVGIRVEVNDGEGGITVSPATLLAINVASPTVGIAGPTIAVPGQPLQYVLTATPSPGGPAGNFTFHIDWNGDGLVDQSLSGPSGTTVGHVFSTIGTPNIRVTGIDANGGKSAEAVQGVTVSYVTLQPNLQNPSLTDVVFGATDGNDFIYIFSAGPQSATIWYVSRNGTPVNQTFIRTGITGTVVGYAMGGNDFVLGHQQSAFGLIIYGGGGADTLAGGTIGDTLYGEDGPDLLYGMLGNDELHGGQEVDVLIGDGGGETPMDGHDTLYGDDGDDRIIANSGHDVVYGGEGDDLIYGQRGRDTVWAGDGNDFVDGAREENTIYGEEGNDAILALFSADYVDGGIGDDSVFTDEGNDTLIGGPGNDVLMGGEGNDLIDGQEGDDILLGNEQDDTLIGGAGRDMLFGGDGADFLQGEGDDDLLLAGYSAFDYDFDLLVALQAEWLSPRDYASRIANLSGTGTGPRNNGDYFLAPGVTVFDDGAADTLSGGNQWDWFIYHFLQDQLTDLEPGETTTDA